MVGLDEGGVLRSNGGGRGSAEQRGRGSWGRGLWGSGGVGGS